MKKYLLFILIIIFVSCNHNNSNKNLFKNKYNIKSIILIAENQLYDPWDILALDSNIVIANQKGDPLIEIYNHKGKCVKKFLHVGSGPEEILVVGSLQEIKEKKALLVYDLFQKKFLKYSLTDFTDKPSEIISFSNSYSNDSVALFDKLFVGKECLIGESRMPNGRIILMTKKGDFIKYIGKFPEKVDPKLTDFENAHLYGACFAFNSAKSKLAMATFTAGMLDLFNVKSNGLEPIFSYQEFLPENLNIVQIGENTRAAFTNNSRYGYTSITASDKYVYALFSGRKFNSGNYSYGNTIRVLDWNTQKSFELISDIDLRRISVAKDDKFLYAIAKNSNNDPEIVRFDIENIIKNIK